jgi:hypothetical protein
MTPSQYRLASELVEMMYDVRAANIKMVRTA